MILLITFSLSSSACSFEVNLNPVLLSSPVPNLMPCVSRLKNPLSIETRREYFTNKKSSWMFS
ncbi:ORF134 [White spot syndrome virus]|uniref:ORF134 n=1 Tax=White spot syndrome virus TaxID=342409 RepID=A0A2D3I734_9VIRU|nr:ORF134 [White spot syndrome virus]